MEEKDSEEKDSEEKDSEEKDSEDKARKRNGAEEEPPAVSEGKEIVLHRETTCLNCGVAFDREKVFCPQCGLKDGETKYLPSDTFISPISPMERVSRGVGFLPLISFLLGILGPIFFGIGWLLAIILGLISLSAISKRGGSVRDRKMALSGIILGFVWPIVIGLGLLLFSYRSAGRRRISRNEVSAISDLRNIALAEKFAKSGFFFDRDSDGKSEYGNLTDLAAVNFPYFDLQLVSGEKNGYLFRIDRVTEEGFLAVAVPLTYGITGRRIFSIDRSGILRGADTGGKSILEVERTLPKVFSQSVFDEFDDEIAGDLLQKAKQEAKKQNFDKARKIVGEIRRSYYLSPALREVDSVLDSITAYIAENKSQEDYQRAKVLINEEKYPEALVLLRTTEKKYPKSSFLPEISREIEKTERELAGIREKEANKLFTQGQRLEVEGKYEEALRSYEKIREEFKSTSYFKKVNPLLDLVRKKIEEEKAENLFARLGGLKPEKDWAEILRITSLLRTGYGKTDLVKGRQSILDVLQSRSRGQDYRNKGLAELKKKDYQVALESLENALRADSGLTGELKIPLQTSYLKLGDKYFQENNYEQAVVHYENYLKLAPARVELDNAKYNEAYYQLGKLEYSKGNLEKAKESLLKVRHTLRKKPELFYLLGSILAREKNYPGALGYLNAALKLEAKNAKFLYKRGFCLLAMAWQLENELSGLLVNEDKSLRKGRDFVNAAATIINEAEAKGIQLGLQARPKVLEGKKQLTPQQIKEKKLAATERETYLAKMRVETAQMEKDFQANKSRRVEITAKLKSIYESMIMGRNSLEKAAVLEKGDNYFWEIINPLRKKEQLFNQGRNKMELGLNQERFIEKGALSALKLSLRNFKSRKSGSSPVEGIKTVYNSLSISQLEDNLQEGRELLRKAGAIDISVDKYLATEAIP